MIELECLNGHEHAYETAVMAPIFCPDCGADLLNARDPQNPDDTRTDKI